MSVLPHRPVRPVLILLVYGTFLVVVGVTAAVQTALISGHLSSGILNATLTGDGGAVRKFAAETLRVDDVAGGVGSSRAAELQGSLADLTERLAAVRAELRTPAGLPIATSDGAGVGMTGDATAALARAAGGAVDVSVSAATGDAETATGLAAGDPVLHEYFPLIDESGMVRAIVALARDARPMVANLDRARSDLLTVTLSAAAIAGAVLFFVFRSAQYRIRRQTEQLVETTSRDAMTGMLNHGAVVAQLTAAVEAARGAGTSIAIALIDLDNFRLLNDTHGHVAGDAALLRLSQAITTAGSSPTVGRYGPDEFLVIARGEATEQLEALVTRVSGVLAGDSLQFESSERLPMSISAGIAAFPADADSVTQLLSAVAVALAEAKASGGGAVRLASRQTPPAAEVRMFNALQGLVFAIDTKDRYTKRHSEEVARYGVLLARHLALDSELIDAVWTAGLLHDVGKIGTPDALLRKPGRLSPEEFDIIKQHVALGDVIVRDVSNVELVRAGVRHHHERWDGQGYLHALGGQDIPLIARILAIGDAFSAMTSDRPYRKALPTPEALRRLGDAAGTQLDERLVTAFIAAMETAPEAEVPAEAAAAALWVPTTQVA